jgi:mono/diheme cytochrome c family protein
MVLGRHFGLARGPADPRDFTVILRFCYAFPAPTPVQWGQMLMRVLSLFALSVSAMIFFSSAARAQESDHAQELVRSLKLSFAADSSSVLFLEQNGRKYKIDVATRSITEMNPGSVPIANVAFAQPAAQPATPASAPQATGQALFQANCARCHGADGKGIHSIGTPDFVSIGVAQAHVASTIRSGRPNKMPSFTGRLSDADIASISQYVESLGSTGASGTPRPDVKPGVYTPGDDVLFSLPTGRPPDPGALYVNFQHRFPYTPALSGTDRGDVLFGLDESALPSLGLRYGITDKLSVDLMRSPTFIGRPLQLQTAYSFLSEQNSAPFNFTARVSVEGQNDFRKNYTEDLEGIFSRSITHRAQVYLVPTISFNDRRVVQGGLVDDKIPDYPGINAFSLGGGFAVDVRPTIALVGEIIPTLIGADQLGIHRPAFSFGIQKKIYRHAFTFGVTNSPGVTVSQRAGTDATFLNNPHGDIFKNMFLGFDLTRQIH